MSRTRGFDETWQHFCVANVINDKTRDVFADCKPYVCRYPMVRFHHAGDRWTCPNCGARYRLTRPKRARWWRRWSAPDGHWRFAGYAR